MNKKPIKITFEPECFDNFEGTQEELDKMIEEIQRMADSGELMENAIAVNLDDADDETMDAIASLLGNELAQAQRKLQ